MVPSSLRAAHRTSRSLPRDKHLYPQPRARSCSAGFRPTLSGECEHPSVPAGNCPRPTAFFGTCARALQRETGAAAPGPRLAPERPARPGARLPVRIRAPYGFHLCPPRTTPSRDHRAGYAEVRSNSSPARSPSATAFLLPAVKLFAFLTLFPRVTTRSWETLRETYKCHEIGAQTPSEAGNAAPSPVPAPLLQLSASGGGPW